MKRFTEALKWDDPWFQALDPDHRWAWLYLLDRCDCAGVWEPNFRTGNFYLARDIDWPAVKAAFVDSKRVMVLPSGKWWVCKFIEFQYGELKPKSPIHQKVLTLLLRHGCDESQLEAFVKGWRRVQEALEKKQGLGKASRSLQEEEEEEEEEDRKGSVRGKNYPNLEEWLAEAHTKHPDWPKISAEAAWSHYEANGWRTGKNPVKRWRACIGTCYGFWREKLPPGAASAGPKPPLTIPEPADWHERFNRDYPDSRYTVGGSEEAKKWADLPRTIQEQLAGNQLLSASVKSPP